MTALVRVATDADLAAIRFIGITTWPPTYGPFAGPSYVVSGLDEYWSVEAISSAIHDENIFVVIEDDEVVGTAQVDVLDGDLVMWKLYVLPSRQGSGIGRALLNAVKQRAANENRTLLTEYVAANERAGAFYRSQGFVEIESATSPLSSVWLRYDR